ncbi:major facilitator superfamily domain-containing protein 6-like isoform X2 [Haliotis cracherodii]|uniref:major facilitator superfamily domain-containing protein 6-like isoform X2 n=1 Tax=Haliotis cracherodii TaxID=6455 RepID=UPI0039E98FC3
MATDFDAEETPASEGYPQPTEDREYQHTAKRLNSGPPNPARPRDLIDTLFTVVNRDLLICKLFYFFFFGAFGSLFPLLAIYFKQLGMNPSQSGVLIGFRPFIEFLSAPFWGGIADRYKRAKELLLFSLFCWIIFTLAIAFVTPPAERCINNNGTHDILITPLGRERRETSFHIEEQLGMARNLYTRHHDEKENILVMRHRRGTGESPRRLDHTKYANANESDVKGLLHSPFSTIVYREDEVQEVFFILLLLVVIGEFFSAPAITFADSVTLAVLGDDTENYGRQRMFGSLGWGLSMFFVGLALDHSTTFPQHPCGTQHHAEKNYVVCFAVFTVLMSCAFITALQLRFDHQGQGREIVLSQITMKVKDKVKQTITGIKKIDRQRLIEEDDDDAYTNAELEKQRVQEQEQKQQQEWQQQQQQQQQQQYQGDQKPGSDRPLHISLGKDHDMVTDALKAPGAVAPGDYDYSGDPFMSKWMTVIKMLGTYKYISVLFIAWFMGFGIGIIFTFLFWHLQDLGGSPTLFGLASVINHISELLAYFMSTKFIASFGHVRVLYAGLLGNILRFMYISWLKNPWWVLPFEFVQGLTHAAVWAACCSYITQAIPKSLRASAQGILQGLHHGLGRGCGAVFGGILVYHYGSEITFRAYGVCCIVILVVYLGVNYFLEDRGFFSHGGSSKMTHQILEENTHLAPHGVPSGIARDLSSSKLDQESLNTEYGATTYDGMNTLPVKSPGFANGNYRGFDDGAFTQGYQQGGQDSLLMQEPPNIPTQIYQQQPYNTYDQGYGP